jgi:hypothetical protein
MNNSSPQPKAKQYAKPTLTVYGNIQQLTKQQGPHGPNIDGGIKNMQKTGL